MRKARFIASFDLIHGIDRAAPLINLLVPVPHVNDLAGLIPQNAEHDLVRVLRLIQKDIVGGESRTAQRPELR